MATISEILFAPFPFVNEPPRVVGIHGEKPGFDFFENSVWLEVIAALIK
jgi:hypothetical protein